MRSEGRKTQEKKFVTEEARLKEMKKIVNK
jgi:hypothetical protein